MFTSCFCGSVMEPFWGKLLTRVKLFVQDVVNTNADVLNSEIILKICSIRKIMLLTMLTVMPVGSLISFSSIGSSPIWRIEMSMSCLFWPKGILNNLSVLVMNSGRNVYTRFRADGMSCWALLILAKSGFFEGFARSDSTIWCARGCFSSINSTFSISLMIYIEALKN